MMGRGAYGRPWLVGCAQARHWLRGEMVVPPPRAQRIEIMRAALQGDDRASRRASWRAHRAQASGLVCRRSWPCVQHSARASCKRMIRRRLTQIERHRRGTRFGGWRLDCRQRTLEPRPQSTSASSGGARGAAPPDDRDRRRQRVVMANAMAEEFFQMGASVLARQILREIRAVREPDAGAGREGSAPGLDRARIRH